MLPADRSCPEFILLRGGFPRFRCRLPKITSADRLYAGRQSARLSGIRSSLIPPSVGHMEETLLLAQESTAPLVTALDGASHALAFLGAFGQRTVPLGMDRFGQSGARADLYNSAGIDAGQFVNAALVALSQ